VTCDVQADDLLVMREQNYQLGRDNSRLRRRLAELQKVRAMTLTIPDSGARSSTASVSGVHVC